MRKILAWLIDLLWWLQIVLWLALGVFVYFLKTTGNLLDVSSLLHSHINSILLWAYIIIVLLLLLYFIIGPFIIGATLGEYILGIGISEEIKLDPFKLFLYYLTVPLLQILLLPYVIYLKLKKISFAKKLSGVHLDKRNFDPLRRLLLLLLFLGMSTFTVLGLLMFKHSGLKLLTKFIDYRRYADQALRIKDYRALSSILLQYEERYGKDANYWVYYCVSSAQNNLPEDLSKLEQVCKKAIRTNMDKQYRYEVLLALINIYKKKDDATNLVNTYQKLWELGYRGTEMLEYIKLVGENSADQASKMLGAWKKANPINQLTISNISALAELYLELKDYKQALSLFKHILEKTNNPSVQAAASFKIGECYYFLKDYKNAKKYLLKAQKLDKHYTNLVESYIIDMSLKGYK